ncbi:hypothetical protein TcWFU_000080 [Taenia crassiceps]|uniref:Uncharacterized protein n=1 Tax=Taenia crassiceps TaxID=6207 RepID=A0ABR4QN17_9CEST
MYVCGGGDGGGGEGGWERGGSVRVSMGNEADLSGAPLRWAHFGHKRSSGLSMAMALKSGIGRGLQPGCNGVGCDQ